MQLGSVCGSDGVGGPLPHDVLVPSLRGEQRATLFLW